MAFKLRDSLLGLLFKITMRLHCEAQIGPVDTGDWEAIESSRQETLASQTVGWGRCRGEKWADLGFGHYLGGQGGRTGSWSVQSGEWQGFVWRHSRAAGWGGCGGCPCVEKDELGP